VTLSLHLRRDWGSPRLVSRIGHIGLACEAGHVEVELLVVPDCPNGMTASRALLEAARLAGVEDDLRVNVTVVKTDDEAQRLGSRVRPHS
jgi:hypothetical protein